MTTDNINRTRETLLQDTDTLKQDAGQLVVDVKKHALAHMDAAKSKADQTYTLARDYVKEHPLHLAAFTLFLGFLIGIFRRK